MLHTNFQVSKPNGSEEAIFEHFPMYLYGLNQGLMVAVSGEGGAILDPRTFLLNKIGKGPLGNATSRYSNI